MSRKKSLSSERFLDNLNRPRSARTEDVSKISISLFNLFSAHIIKLKFNFDPVLDIIDSSPFEQASEKELASTSVLQSEHLTVKNSFEYFIKYNKITLKTRMKNVNEKILWIADFELNTSPGGAQRSDKILIDKGIELGYSITKANNETLILVGDIHKFDIVISSNIELISHKYPYLIDELNKHKYHVRLEHDSNTYLNQERRKTLFENCKKTIFLTDYHFEFFKESYGNIFNNVEIIYDPIDTSVFFDRKQQREDKILYAGYMHHEKGATDFFEYVLQNKDKNFVIAGFTDRYVYDFLSKNIPNIEYLGLVEYEKMPDIYNKYKYMFYCPLLREPFCRSTAEAVCCGTLLLTNAESRIGSVQEIKKIGIEKFKEKCKNASNEFWNKM